MQRKKIWCNSNDTLQHSFYHIDFELKKTANLLVTHGINGEVVVVTLKCRRIKHDEIHWKTGLTEGIWNEEGRQWGVKVYWERRYSRLTAPQRPASSSSSQQTERIGRLGWSCDRSVPVYSLISLLFGPTVTHVSTSSVRVLLYMSVSSIDTTSSSY